MKRLLTGLAAATLLLVAGLTVAGALYRPETRIPAGLAGRTIDVAGNAIRYAQSGAGADVLLIHGSPGSLEDWQPVVEALQTRFRVTAFDRPGHAYSGSRGYRYTYASNAKAASGLVEALGMREVVVVGHSYGGPTALTLVLDRPELVRSVVVVDSQLFGRTRDRDPLYPLLAVPGLGTGVARLLTPSVAPRRIRRELAEVFPGAPQGFVERRLAIWLQPKVVVSLARERLNASGGRAALELRYREIARPLFIVAQADDAGRRDDARRLQREVAGSELTLLPGTGHYIQFEKTAELVAVIERAAVR